jgi:hypothetical protein
VGRRARDSLEHPKEVVGAQTSDPGEALQVLRDFGIIVDDQVTGLRQNL